jgi:hypothetical protein
MRRIAVAVGLAAWLVGCEPAVPILDLSHARIEIRVEDVDEVVVQIDPPRRLDDSCQLIDPAAHATFNGRPMTLATTGRALPCSSVVPGGTCVSCESVQFRLTAAFEAANADAHVDVVISDGKQTVTVRAVDALRPSAFSIVPPQSNHLSPRATLNLQMTPRPVPLTSIDLSFARHVDNGRVQLEFLGSKDVSVGTFWVEMPLSIGEVVLEALGPALSSPLVELCAGAVGCFVNPTNIVGALSLVVEPR